MKKRRFVDLSIAIEPGLPSDPPMMIPKIDYVGHEQGAEQMKDFFPGVTREQAPRRARLVARGRLPHDPQRHPPGRPCHYHPTMDRGRRAMTIDEIPLEWCMGDGVVLDFRHKADGERITLADVRKALERIRYEVKPLDIVLHDIFEPGDPPERQEINVFRVRDRIGSPICLVDPKKIARVVATDLEDESGAFDQPTPVTERIGQNVADFLVNEMKQGRIPPNFLPLQSGVGYIANAVPGALGGDSRVPPFEMYTEVLQDSVVPLLEGGRCTFASTTALTLSPEMMRHVTSNLDFFRAKILLRPQEITNHPEIVRRLGIVSMNTAIEVDLTGNVNSTHVMGKSMMNGIGGLVLGIWYFDWVIKIRLLFCAQFYS